MTRSITSWFRIEPVADEPSAGPERALQARVFDPAWLLGRQWQLGELTGEDAASPAAVRLRLASTPFTRVRLNESSPARRVEAGELLEPAVEAEPPTEDWAASVAAGEHLAAALVRAGLDRLVSPMRVEFPLSDPDPATQDRAARARFRILARTGLDGLAVLDAVRAPDGQVRLPLRPQVDADVAPGFEDVLRRWSSWYPQGTAGAGEAWVPERLEYRFTIAARDPRGAGEVVFDAPEYQGGRLDWHDLRAAPSGPSLGAAVDAEPTRWVHASLPTRVRYPGMPTNRWWEFEDSELSFGHVEAEGGDLARMLLVEFATVYGNDWFLAPCDAPFGTVVAVEALVIVDTFGRQTLNGPSDEPGWRMFEVTGAPAGLLVLLDVAAAALTGPPLEEVRLVRDETANMAWAIEHRVTGAVGNAVDRHEQWRDRLAATERPPPPADLPPDVLMYELASDPPDHWIPLVPHADGHRSIRLRRGAIVRADGEAALPLGRLLEPGAVLDLYEEEVPRGGVTVTRAWQLARSATGETTTWIGRRARSGRGDVRSGLRFDQLDPPAQ